MEGRPLPRKKDVVLTLLEGPSVFLHLDPRRDGVVVPKWLAKQPQLVLQVGLNMSVPIPDLRVDDEGVTCTLSFNRAPFWCKLPWPAIYAAIGEDRRGMVWPDDVPSEVATQMQKKPAGPGGPQQGSPHERGRPARGRGRGQAHLAVEAAAPRGRRRGRRSARSRPRGEPRASRRAPREHAQAHARRGAGDRARARRGAHLRGRRARAPRARRGEPEPRRGEPRAEPCPERRGRAEPCVEPSVEPCVERRGRRQRGGRARARGGQEEARAAPLPARHQVMRRPTSLARAARTARRAKIHATLLERCRRTRATLP